MKFLSKPSHYLGLMIAGVVFLLATQGEKVLPKEGPKRTEYEKWLAQHERLEALRQNAQLRDVGTNDMLVKSGEQAAGGPDAGGEPQATVPTLVTLHGSVVPELCFPGTEPSSEARPRPEAVTLELVWRDAGAPFGPSLRTGSTDSTGAYEFADLKPGSYRLRAIPERDSRVLPVAVDLQVPELAEAGDQQGRFEASLVLPLPRTLRGHLKTSEDKPLAGVRVSVTETGLVRGEATVDTKGSFEIAGVGDGPYRFRLLDGEGKELELLEDHIDPQKQGNIPVALVARAN
ncbi:MAG: carboxypeptidase-like regulatory domain-containing protein [Planctomycetota bacterium]